MERHFSLHVCWMSKKTNAIVECWAVNHRLYILGNGMNDDIVLSSTPFSADSPCFIFSTARHVYSSLPTPIVLWLSPCVTSSCLIRSTSHLHSPRPTHDFDLRRACDVKSRHLITSDLISVRFSYFTARWSSNEEAFRLVLNSRDDTFTCGRYNGAGQYGTYKHRGISRLHNDQRTRVLNQQILDQYRKPTPKNRPHCKKPKSIHHLMPKTWTHCHPLTNYFGVWSFIIYCSP